MVVNNAADALIMFAPTGSYGEFSRSAVALPGVLSEGENQIRLERRRDGERIDLDAIEISAPHSGL